MCVVTLALIKPFKVENRDVQPFSFRRSTTYLYCMLLLHYCSNKKFLNGLDFHDMSECHHLIFPVKSMSINIYQCVFLPSGKDFYYVTYYISSRGSNKITCGGTSQTACRTLKQVLGLYYSMRHPSPLKIITSKTLVFDHRLMVRFTRLFLIQYNIGKQTR